MSTSMYESAVCLPPERSDGAMEIACRLAGHGAIGAMHVVMRDRLTYDELLHYRLLAEANDLSLTVTADCIILRPMTPQAALHDEDSVSFRDEVAATWHRFADTWQSARRRVVDRAGASTAGQWLRTHLGKWDAGFTGLNEGTR